MRAGSSEISEAQRIEHSPLIHISAAFSLSRMKTGHDISLTLTHRQPASHRLSVTELVQFHPYFSGLMFYCASNERSADGNLYTRPGSLAVKVGFLDTINSL